MLSGTHGETVTQRADGTQVLRWPVGPAGQVRAEVRRGQHVVLIAQLDDGARVVRWCVGDPGVLVTLLEELIRMLGVPAMQCVDITARQMAAAVMEALD